uniref:H2B histone-fold n=1 Tax=Solanum tuberosum TaxID=4113 RepID=M1CRI5_SOLTU
MISSWFNEFGDLLSGDGCILSSLPLDVFPGVASFEDFRRLIPSALMVERVEQ